MTRGFCSAWADEGACHAQAGLWVPRKEPRDPEIPTRMRRLCRRKDADESRVIVDGVERGAVVHPGMRVEDAGVEAGVHALPGAACGGGGERRIGKMEPGLEVW